MSATTGKIPPYQAWSPRVTVFESLVRKASPFQPVKDSEGYGYKVGGGDAEPLIDYLLGDGPLSDDDRESLAWLIENYAQLIKRKVRGNGRPRGSISNKNAAVVCACYLVRIGKGVWRQKHDRKRVPKAVTNSLIKRAIELTEAHDRFSKARVKISADAVGDKSLVKPDRETVAYVSENLDEAMSEIIELAQK